MQHRRSFGRARRGQRFLPQALISFRDRMPIPMFIIAETGWLATCACGRHRPYPCNQTGSGAGWCVAGSVGAQRPCHQRRDCTHVSRVIH
jgi:hypothetical protein